MLVAALGLTMLGFAFLVAAVATGQILWAWACIGVGALGLLLLVVDLIRGRSGHDEAGGDPGATPSGNPDGADARTGG
ncbi:hypothetical protein [Dietzia sp. 179-F 9C3 NHS]|uniref:hypothetical protein n=1 Tax=Dietzia sp. 179-F 9C3 NHS TaxID=3374295 RepID=UPI003879CFE1